MFLKGEEMNNQQAKKEESFDLEIHSDPILGELRASGA